MRRTGNKDENKRILMDLDVVLKSHDCPYIIQCYGAIVTNVSHTHRSFSMSHHLNHIVAVSLFCLKCQCYVTDCDWSSDGCVHRNGADGDVCWETQEEDPGAHPWTHPGQDDCSSESLHLIYYLLLSYTLNSGFEQKLKFWIRNCPSFSITILYVQFVSWI